MAIKTRIPRGIDEFGTYLHTTSDHLIEGTPVSNGVRLGILPEEITTWTSMETEWNPLYLKYSDKKNSRTTSVRNELLLIIERTVDFDKSNHILDRIASSTAATIADMAAFNINKGVLQRENRSFSTTPIREMVTTAMQLLGGGSIVMKCYTLNGQRAAIYEEADCVQYMYSVGHTPPESAEANGLTKEVSTKAIFTLALGPGSTAKYLYIFYRWYNTRHPELAGPWSAMQTTLIL